MFHPYKTTVSEVRYILTNKVDELSKRNTQNYTKSMGRLESVP